MLVAMHIYRFKCSINHYLGMGPGLAAPPQQEIYPGQMYGAPPPSSMTGMPSAFDGGQVK